MTGLELLQHLQREKIEIPTIIMTAFGDRGLRARCELAGAIAFLSKPLQTASLFAAIDAVSRVGRQGERTDTA